MKVIISGTAYEGMPVEIVNEMWENCFHKENFKDSEDYMKWMIENVEKFTGVKFSIEGSSLEDRTQSFLNRLETLGLLAKIKE